MIRDAARPRFPLLLFLFAACASTGERDANGKDLVRRFVAAANAHDYDALDAILAPDFVRHSQATPGVEVRSAEDMRRFLEANEAALPDERVTFASLTAEGDRVAFRGTYTGTHTGAMGPIPATGRSIDIDVSGEFRIASGRIAELWILWDNVTLFGQLGVAPPGGAPADGRELGADATAERKALARVWFDEVINARDLDAIDRNYADDYVHHGPDGAVISGLDAVRGFAAAILAASSDRVAIVEQQVAEGDLVVTRFTSRGTNDGPFRGMPPTGNAWVTEGICISRIQDGKVAEDWEIVSHSGP